LLPRHLSYHYIDDETYDQLVSSDGTIQRLVAQLQQCRDDGIELIPFFDDRYPDRLAAVSGPILLYARGDTSLLVAQDSIGFTGTREATAEAVDWTRELAADLASEGRVIISGGASGIDTAAHQGALEATGKTISIFGTGINVPYPEENQQLFDRIIKEGGLILSQRPPDAGPSRSGFLNRNETLTGLSQAVVVAATDGSGGTMTTYKSAKSQGRLIFCPDPQLELEPVAGIETISSDAAIPIRRAEELLAYQDEQRENVQASQDSSDSNQTGGQRSLDDYT